MEVRGSVSRSGRFTPDTNWMVGSGVDMDAVEKIKVLSRRESNPDRPARRHTDDTDWVIPNPYVHII
jgi:hypothetical protein